MRKQQFFWLFGFVAGMATIGLFLQRWNRQFIKYQVQSRALSNEAGQLHLGKQVQVTTRLDGPAEKLWQLVITSGLTEHLSWPWLSFLPIDQPALPAIWTEKDLVRVQLRLLGIIPLGWHTIGVEKIDHEDLCLKTREMGQIVPLWNHTIELQAHGDHQTLYTDTIDLYAGNWTNILAGLVSWFLRYRQARMKKLGRGLAQLNRNMSYRQ